MNLSRRLPALLMHLYNIVLKSKRLLPKQECQAFGLSTSDGEPRIGTIYVINLDRQPDRWIEVQRELKRILDESGAELTGLTTRFSAVDARDFAHEPPSEYQVNPSYALRDQLFVEPQPNAMPVRLELDRPIRMSWPEVAIAESHIGVWRRIAEGAHEYSLVLEDDVLFRWGFARLLDRAWSEIQVGDEGIANLDMLYLSYKEVKNGAQKVLLTPSLFRPVRGLWFLSGYVLSRGGAKKLLQLLPCRGPVDLWINHKFEVLDVCAIRRPIIFQRRNCASTNLYSILPALTRIGAINSQAASTFRFRPPRASGVCVWIRRLRSLISGNGAFDAWL